jgi:hypothetical protein
MSGRCAHDTLGTPEFDAAWERLRNGCPDCEWDALVVAANAVLAEYESHGGPGTHQECMTGCQCQLPAAVAELRRTLGERAHKWFQK